MSFFGGKKKKGVSKKRVRMKEKRRAPMDTSRQMTALFDKYRDEGEDEISPEGMMSFCEDLDIDPSDIRMLVAAKELGASQMGYFTKDEFVKGFARLGCDSLSSIKVKLTALEKQLATDRKAMRELHKFSYEYIRGESAQKSIDTETAISMMTVTLGGGRFKWAEPIFEFLKQSSYKVVTRDQYASILEFCQTFPLEIKGYADDDAWPVMLDEFVEWQEEQ